MSEVNGSPDPGESASQAAERALIGALLLDGVRIRDIGLSSDDFATVQCAEIFRAIGTLVEAGTHVEFVSVSDALGSRLVTVGGMSALVELASSVTSTAHVIYHAQLVSEASAARALRREVAALAKSAQDPDADRETLAERAESVAKALRGKTEKRVAVKRYAYPDPGPFPESLFDPPGLLGSLTRWINASAIRAQPALALGNSLAALGALFGRRYKTPTNLRTSVYCVGLAPTGAGKEHSRQQIKSLFARAGVAHLLGGERLASGQGLLAAMRRSPSALFQLDEFGELMASIASPHSPHYSAAILPILLQLYSSAGTIFRGQEYAGTDKDNPRVDIVEPCPCIWGTSTPDTFFASLSSRRVLDGYLGRLIVFASSDPRPPRFVPASMDPPDALVAEVKAAWLVGQPASAFADLSLGDVATAQARLVPLTADAEEYLLEIDRRIDRELALRRHRGTAALWQRAEENTLRAALVLAVGQDPADPVIVESDVAWAAGIVFWSIGLLEHACAEHVHDTPFEADLQRLLGLLREAGSEGLTRSQVARAARWADSRRRADLLGTLLESGAAREMLTHGKRGPPATVFVSVDDV